VGMLLVGMLRLPCGHVASAVREQVVWACWCGHVGVASWCGQVGVGLLCVVCVVGLSALWAYVWLSGKLVRVCRWFFFNIKMLHDAS
jgi:hypothetical protein